MNENPDISTESCNILPIQALEKLAFDFNFDGFILSLTRTSIVYRDLNRLVSASFIRSERNIAADILDIFFSTGKTINDLNDCLGHFEVYRDFQHALLDPELFNKPFDEVVSNLCEVISEIVTGSINGINQMSVDRLQQALESTMNQLGITTEQCWNAHRRITGLDEIKCTFPKD